MASERMIMVPDWLVEEAASLIEQAGLVGTGVSLAAERLRAVLAQPAAGEPVYQYRGMLDDWIEIPEGIYKDKERLGYDVRTLWTAPPAAAPAAAGEPVAWADNIALGRIASGRSVVTLSNVETVEYSIPLFRVAPPADAQNHEKN